MISTGTSPKLEMKYRTLRSRLRPYRRVRHIGDTTGEWETISYPWIDGRRILVNIRRPDEPTTIITVNALGVDPVLIQCQCADPNCPAAHIKRCPNNATTMGVDNTCGPSRVYHMCQFCVGDD